MPHSFRRYALVLGSLAAIGPLATDIYLPAFPAIARDLGTDEGAIQRSLVTWFFGMALGQMIHGPISDRFGRRLPLAVGFALFTLASVGCVLVRSADALTALRVVQAVGACAGVVLTMAVVRDLFTGIEAARMFSAIILVLGVAPIIAPLIGSILLGFFPWPAIFWFMAGFGVYCVVLILWALPETHPPERRTSGSLGDVLTTYGRLLRNKRFIGIIATITFAQAGFFAYLAGSSHVFIALHGLSPMAYSVLFAANSVALIAAAQMNVPLIRRLGAPRLVQAAITVFAGATTVLLAATLTGLDTFSLVAGLLFVAVGSIGFIFPVGSMLALDPHGENAGAASALLSSLQFAGGAVSSGLVSFFFDGTARPMVIVIAVCGLCAFAASLVALPKERAPA